MTPEVRDRIEQIQHGNVPEGYKKTESGIIQNEWRAGQVCECIEEYKALSNDIVHIPVYSSSRKGLMPQSDYYDQREAVETNLGYKVVPQGYVTYRHMSDDDIFHFNINRTGGDVLVSSEYPVFTSSEKCDLGFLIPALNNTARFRYFCKTQKLGGTRTRLYLDNLKKYALPLPPFSEQAKIAEILTGQDKMIELKEKRLAEKQRQKKYLMQQLLTGKKRLPGFVEDWKIAPIGNFLEARNTKQIPCEEAPLMAFIAGEGVASKGERYDRSHLVKDDTKKYKRTELNDFIYSSNNLDVGSIGLNKYGTAVISVVYEIFRSKENVVPAVISEIIQMPRNLHHILSYRQGAFYGQYRIFAEDFLSVPIKAPCYEEQLAIGALLDTADNEIDLLRQELEQEKQKKKALMQLLLTGIVRVNV